MTILLGSPMEPRVAFTQNFSIVPNEVYRLKVSDTARITLVYLISLAGRHLACWPRHQTIGDTLWPELAKTRRRQKALEAVNELEKVGAIETFACFDTENNARVSNMIRINQPSNWDLYSEPKHERLKWLERIYLVPSKVYDAGDEDAIKAAIIPGTELFNKEPLNNKDNSKEMDRNPSKSNEKERNPIQKVKMDRNPSKRNEMDRNSGNHVSKNDMTDVGERIGDTFKESATQEPDTTTKTTAELSVEQKNALRSIGFKTEYNEPDIKREILNQNSGVTPKQGTVCTVLEQTGTGGQEQKAEGIAGGGSVAIDLDRYATMVDGKHHRYRSFSYIGGTVGGYYASTLLEWSMIATAKCLGPDKVQTTYTDELKRKVSEFVRKIFTQYKDPEDPTKWIRYLYCYVVHCADRYLYMKTHRTFGDCDPAWIIPSFEKLTMFHFGRIFVTEEFMEDVSSEHFIKSAEYILSFSPAEIFERIRRKRISEIELMRNSQNQAADASNLKDDD